MFTDSASEGAFHMAEQFGFQQLFRKCPAVDCNHRAVAQFVCLVQRARQQFLAGTATAGDQHADIGAGYLFDLIENSLHKWAAGNDAFAPVFEYLTLCAAGLLECGANRGQHLVFVDRFGEKLEHTFLCSRHRLRYRALGGHDDDGQPGVKMADLLEEFQAAGALHAQIRDYQIDRFIAQGEQRLFGGYHSIHREALCFHTDGKQPQQACIVVYQ